MPTHWKVDDGAATSADLDWLVDCTDIIIPNGLGDDPGGFPVGFLVGFLSDIFGGGLDS